MSTTHVFNEKSNEHPRPLVFAVSYQHAKPPKSYLEF